MLSICKRELNKFLKSEGNHQQQKANTNVIKEGDQVPAPQIRITWKFWPSGPGFRVKWKRLWDLPLQL